MTVPLHPDLPDDQVGYILRNSGASWVFVDGDRRERLAGLLPSLPRTVTPVVLDDAGSGEELLVHLLGEGAGRSVDRPLDRLLGRVEPDDLATLAYTGGATGEPKGAVLTHRALVANLLACDAVLPLASDDFALSLLPLATPWARTLAYLCLYRGVHLHYLPRRQLRSLPYLRPTLLLAPSAAYAEVYHHLQETLATRPVRRRLLLERAMAASRRCLERRAAGEGGWRGELQRILAQGLVLRPLRRPFGGRLRCALVVGEALPTAVESFFRAAGLTLLPGYGLAEAGSLVTIGRPQAHRPGSVGLALPGVEVRTAADGEVLVRTPSRAAAIWPARPEGQPPAAGWLATGDLGELDDTGALFLRGRKAFQVRTAAGTEIDPQSVERALTVSSLIAHALVLGEGLPRLVALLFPDLRELVALTGEDAPPRAVSHPRATQAVQEAVRSANAELPEDHRLRRFRLLPTALSVADGTLTPTGTVRRHEVLKRFPGEVDSLLEG